MDLRKKYGPFSEQDQQIIGEKRAGDLISLVKNNSNPWIQKAAAIALEGLVGDYMMARECEYSSPDLSLGPTFNDIITNLRKALPLFSSGEGFNFEYDFNSFPYQEFEYGLTLAVGPSDDYDLAYKFLEIISPNDNIDLVMGIHKGGVEAAILTADKVKAGVCNGFYQWKEVPPEKTGFIQIEDGETYDFAGKNVFVVDDVVKDGRSMGKAFEYLKSKGASHVWGAALFRLFDWNLSYFSIQHTKTVAGFEFYEPLK